MSAPAGPAAAAGSRGGCGRQRNRAARYAAREVFAEQGLEAPLEESRCAPGRHRDALPRVPTRTQLVAAAL
jgi:hypothetical protein